MGQEIANAEFGDEHHRIYQRRLREETELLQRWFDRRQFEYRQVPKIGLEVEGWLVDRNHLPIPRNDEFLKRARCPLLVHELSKFNFEMNVSPQELSGRCLSRLSRELEELSALCRRTAGAMDAYPMWIGILPLIRHEMLEPRFMSDSNRYKALNDELFRLRNHRPVNIDIQGRERFEGKVGHFVFEAAATSLQVHIQVNQDEACRFYNASLIASAATVAAAANSPFLYGYDLWDETRIPVFEQAVAAASFRTTGGPYRE